MIKLLARRCRVQVEPRGTRKPSVHRRQAHRLRQLGWSLKEIADELGLTIQGVHYLLKKFGGLRPIVCRLCGSLVCKGEPGMQNFRTRPLCLRCLAGMPDATFGERLRSIRLSHGLSRERLAEASGVPLRTIMGHETGRLAHPRWPMLVKLARLLGPALVGLD